MSRAGRGPDVAFPPPLVFIVAFGGGWLLDRYVLQPGWEWPVGPSPSLEMVGWALVIAGLMLIVWGATTLHRLRTAVYPNRDASTLANEGPYRFTRNPMYTGMAMAYVGGACIVGSLGALVLLPLAMVALYYLVIRREERHLREAFGDSYGEYQRRVRRWL